MSYSTSYNFSESPNASNSGNRTIDHYFNCTGMSDRQQTCLEVIIETYCFLPVSIFGLVGNCLNLLVLTRQSMSGCMERMERSVHAGLIALASSDTGFCLLLLLRVFCSNQADSSLSVTLLYTQYSSALINTFVLTSTWLTVAMAVSRYLAICRPMRARELISVGSARWTIVLVFGLCAIFNLPRYWEHTLYSIQCTDGRVIHLMLPSYMTTNLMAKNTYMWIYFLIGILFPIVLLAVCNWHLIKALKKSAKMRRQHTREVDPTADSKVIVTRTLIIIVLFYIILVLPVELLSFSKDMFSVDDLGQLMMLLNAMIALGNLLEAINFSVNFVLYVIINVKFRRAICDLLYCTTCRQAVTGAHDMNKENKSSVSNRKTDDKKIYMSVGEDSSAYQSLKSASSSQQTTVTCYTAVDDQSSV